MRRIVRHALLWAFSLLPLVGAGQEDVRRLYLKADNDQRYMTTRIFKLHHAQAVDVTPWVLGAVKRNCPQASVERVTYENGESFLVVSMSVDSVPYIEDMIKKLDRPGKIDQFGSIIEGTDVTFFSYTPKYRSTENMIDVVGGSLQGNNYSFYRSEQTNQFFWKDAMADGANAAIWLRFLDRPVPQANVTVHIYETSDNDLIDLGVDYVRWKNGPGLDMFGFGADLLSLGSQEELIRRGLEIFTSANHGWTGMFVAPQIDASFVRMLQQRGRARVASSGSITVANHSADDAPDRVSTAVPSRTYRVHFSPDYQTITKDDDMRVAVGGDENDGQEVSLSITDPAIFFETDGQLHGKTPERKSAYFETHHPSARIIFNYVLDVNNTIEQDVMGAEAVDNYQVNSSTTLRTGSEKLIGAFSRNYDVEERIGIPFLKDIPLLKYLFSTSTRSRQIRHFFVTVKADSISPDADLSPWAGKILSEVNGTIQAVDKGLAVE